MWMPSVVPCPDCHSWLPRVRQAPPAEQAKNHRHNTQTSQYVDDRQAIPTERRVEVIAQHQKRVGVCRDAPATRIDQGGPQCRRRIADAKEVLADFAASIDNAETSGMRELTVLRVIGIAQAQ